MAKHGLGTGLGSLIPENFDNSLLVSEDERIQKLDIKLVEPHAGQPRTHFDEEALAELATSIKNHGILQPLVITPGAGGKYTIIAGERRWRAATKAGLKSVPAIVRTLKELEQLEIALVENVQRVDLSPLEQAVSIERLHSEFNTPYDKIAQRLGKAPSTVNNIVRLLQLPPKAQHALAGREISEGHARAVLALKDNPAAQDRLVDLIIAQAWSVRQAERYVTSHKSGEHNEQKVHARVATETPVTKALSKKLGTKVAVKRMAKGGRLEIAFKTDDELEKLIDILDK